ncbi:hypothetical protein F5X96DRAFT_342297 [Biscogniauxia mediterranea]|nr:hypothetical protein F5X96DRAFT_342297 [Biscogniauxia mediterranea]
MQSLKKYTQRKKTSLEEQCPPVLPGQETDKMDTEVNLILPLGGERQVELLIDYGKDGTWFFVVVFFFFTQASFLNDLFYLMFSYCCLYIFTPFWFIGILTFFFVYSCSIIMVIVDNLKLLPQPLFGQIRKRSTKKRHSKNKRKKNN